MNLTEPKLSQQGALAVQGMPLNLRYDFITALQSAKTVSDLSDEYQKYLANGYKPAKVTKSLDEALDQVKIEWEN